MKPLGHQLKAASKALELLINNGYAYINGQPRSGKTLTSLLVAEDFACHNILVLTKKAAIEGWLKFIKQDYIFKKYIVINYEQLCSIRDKRVIFKYNPSDFQLVIIDESHNIGAYPRPSNRWKTIRIFCRDIPHLHLSGTPFIESANSIYHQMAISKYTPFKHANFYDFFREFGIPNSIYVRGVSIPKYDLFKKELLDYIETFTVYMSQQDAGIDMEIVDKVHYVDLPSDIKHLYNTLIKHKYYEGVISGHTIKIVCDNTMALRTSLHQIEGGTIKLQDNTYEISTAKIEYIKRVFGDTTDMGIMSHFIGERAMLERSFKEAKIYSSNAHAEGVDLSHLKYFIIYSSDYSGAKAVQRRERIANINGSNTTEVHHILCHKAISDQVYTITSKKRDFNNEVFKQEMLDD